MIALEIEVRSSSISPQLDQIPECDFIAGHLRPSTENGDDELVVAHNYWSLCYLLQCQSVLKTNDSAALQMKCENSNYER